METGRPLLQNAMYAAERPALHAQDMHHRICMSKAGGTVYAGCT